MKNPAATTWCKIKFGAAGIAVAALSLFGGAAAMDASTADDVAPVEEEAGGTWSSYMSYGGGWGAGANSYGGTWS